MFKSKENKIISSVIDYLQKKVVKDIPNVNHGGCGVVAEELYHIFSSLNFKPKIVVMTSMPNSVKKFIKNSEITGESIALNHIIISIEGKYVDSTGVYKSAKSLVESNFDGRYKIVSGLTINQLALLNKNYPHWNSSFDREKNIPKIKRRVKKILVNNNIII